MEIRIYSPDLKFLGLIEDHTSLLWNRKYYEPGSFELHTPITKRNIKLLTPGNIVAKRDDKKAIVNGEEVLFLEAGVIEGMGNQESTEENNLTRTGRFLSCYFERRLIRSTINFSGTIETGMRFIFGVDRQIPLAELGMLNGFTETISFQATMKNKGSYLSKLARAGAMGYRLRPDFKKRKLYFETFKGVDRTTSQGVNSRVIFSESYNNLNNAIYTYNEEKAKTCAVVGGEGEGSTRIYVEVVAEGIDVAAAGLELRELFVDAKDVSSEDLTPSEYLEALRQRGLDALNENSITESFECETEPDINFLYKVNYDLGDIVTVRKKNWGIEINQRITEILEVYEDGGMYIVPTLGDALPEKIDWSE